MKIESRKNKFAVLILLLLLLTEINWRIYAHSTNSQGSYKSTTSSSSISGSSSSGKWALSTTLCIVVPVVSVLGFLLIIGVFIMIYWLKKKCKGFYKKRKRDRIVINKKKEEENKEAQKSAATKLERIQIELEESTKNSSWSATISLNNTPNQPSQNCITVPGATVQPNYSNVNPYQRIKNKCII